MEPLEGTAQARIYLGRSFWVDRGKKKSRKIYCNEAHVWQCFWLDNIVWLILPRMRRQPAQRRTDVLKLYCCTGHITCQLKTEHIKFCLGRVLGRRVDSIMSRDCRWENGSPSTVRVVQVSSMTPLQQGKKASAVAIWGALVASLSLDASFVGKITAIHWSAHQWDMSVWGIFLRSRMRKPNKTEHITRLSNASRHRKSTWSSNVVSKLHSQLSIRSPSGLVTGRVPSYTCRLS